MLDWLRWILSPLAGIPSHLQTVPLLRERLALKDQEHALVVRELEAKIADRDRTIEQIGRDKAELGAKVAELERVVEAKDATLKAVEEKLQAQESANGKLQGTVEQLQRQIHVSRASDELDQVATGFLVKIAREPGPWHSVRLAEEFGVEPAAAEHRVNVLLKRQLVRGPAVGTGLHKQGLKVRPEGLAWLRRHGHIA